MKPKTALFPLFTLVVGLVTSAGCLAGKYEKKDLGPALNAATTQVLDQVARERQARNLPTAALVPDLRTFAQRDAVMIARGDESLATAAHQAALHAVQAMGRHAWTFATDCADVSQLRLPPQAVESRDLLMNAAAVPGHDGRVYVVLVIVEPGTSSIRADQMGGGAGGTNPSIESYVHPTSAPGTCGERWPTAAR